MRKLLVILLLLPSLAFGQWRQYHHLTAHGGINIITYVPLDSTHPKPTSSFFPGDGESVPDTNAIYTYGPLAEIKNTGWAPDEYFFCIQFTSAPAPPSDYYAVFDSLKVWYPHMDWSRFSMYGLSYGGQEVWACSEDSVFLTIAKPRFISVMSYEHTICTGCGDQYYPYGKLPMWLFGSLSDSHGVGEFNYWTEILKVYFNATPKLFTTYIGGHCCWQPFFSHTFSDTTTGAGGLSLYQYADQFTLATDPTANAGPDRLAVVVNSAGANPTSQVLLDGSGSLAGGARISSYSWLRVSHPSGAADTIYKASSPKAVVARFSATGTYSYSLTVTDTAGNTSTDTMVVTCTSSPPQLYVPPGALINEVSPNEYSTFYRLNNGLVYQRTFTGATAEMTAMYDFVGTPTMMGSGQYFGWGIDNLGYAYALPHSSYYNIPQWFDTDSSGHLFDSVSYVTGYLAEGGFVRNGIVYVQGTDRMLWFGALGTPIGRPLAIVSPSGKSFAQIIFSEKGLLGLTTDSLLYLAAPCTTNGCGVSWASVSMSGFGIQKAIEIGATRNGGMCALIPDVGHPRNAGQPYCFGNVPYVGGSTGGTTLAAYKTIWQIGGGTNYYPLKSLFRTDETMHEIDTLGHEWAEGQNGGGEIGNGYELINKLELWGKQSPIDWYPYNWDWLTGPFVSPAVNVTPAGHTIIKGFNGGPFSFNAQRLDERDSLWGNGRDKSYEQTWRAMSDGGATYPNGLDLPMVTQISTIWKSIDQRTFVLPVCNAGNDTTITSNNATLHGHTVAASFYTQDSVFWYQMSGPNTPTKTRNDSTLTMTGLTTGTYVLGFRMVDFNGGSIEDTLNLTVSGTGTPPTVNAGSDQSIIFPISSTTLSGTATGNGGATISSTTWTCTSRPGGAGAPTITSPGSLTTTITSLSTIGVYVFQLSATDSNGNVNQDTMQVTISTTAPNGLTFPVRKYISL